MKKFIAACIAIFFTFSSVSSAQASIYNLQEFQDSNDFDLVPPGSNIESVSVFQSTSAPGRIFILAYYGAWVGSDRGLADNLFAVYLDTNLDKVEDYIILGPDVSITSGGTTASFVRASDFGFVSGCNAAAFISGGYSDSSDNYYGISFDKSCIPLNTTINVQVASIYQGSFDFVDFFNAKTSLQSANSKLEKPTAKKMNSYRVPFAGKDPNDLVALSPSILKSVVQVFCEDGIGSGWAIDTAISQTVSKLGYRSTIVTNHHVIENCLFSGNVKVKDSKGKEFAGVVFATDADNDLAGIYVKEGIPGLRWQGERPAQGWWIGVLGSPLQVSGYLTTGVVGALDDSGVLGVTAPIRPGNSGGPVFDREGRVIGVATAYLPGFENINIAGGVTLLCLKVINCPTETSVWSNDLPEGPGNQLPNLGDQLVVQKNLVNFTGNSTALTSAQKSQIKTLLANNPNTQKFICTGVRYISQPSSANVTIAKRARAACDYAKSLKPTISTWYQTKTTTSRNYSGKVLLTLKIPQG